MSRGVVSFFNQLKPIWDAKIKLWFLNFKRVDCFLPLLTAWNSVKVVWRKPDRTRRQPRTPGFQPSIFHSLSLPFLYPRWYFPLTHTLTVQGENSRMSLNLLSESYLSQVRYLQIIVGLNFWCRQPKAQKVNVEI